MALQLRRGHTSSFGKMIATSFAVLALIAQPLVALNLPAAFAIGTNTVTVRGNTAAGENQPGWMFNRDVSTATPFEFKPGNASIGSGGLYVSPIANDFTGTCSSSTPAPMPGCDKFIGEYFYLDSVDSFNSMSYDFKIAGSGTNASAGQFYANVYISNTNSPYHYKDCKLDFVPSVGSASGYTTYTFDKDTVATKVSGTNCGTGTKLADFAGQYIRMIAINVGDTSSNDAGLAGYYDNVVVNGTSSNTFDFEPFVPSIPSNLGFVSSDQVCGGYTNTNWTQPKWGAVVGATSYDYRALYNGSVVFNATYTIPQHPGGSFGSGTNGQWGYQVRSVASNGMKSDWSPVCSITLDTVAPDKPTHEFPANDAFINYNSFYFDWSDVTGASSYEVQFSRSDSTDSNGALNVGVWAGDASHNQPTESRAWSSGANGTWYWQVRAVDAAGNKSGWTVPGKVTIDMVAPEVTIASASQTDTTTANFEGTVSDANLRYYYCYLTTNQTITVGDTTYTPGQEVGMRDANCNTTWANGQTNFNGSLGGFDITGLPTGSYTVNLVAYDRAGNNNAGSPATYTFTIEATPENNGNEGGEGNGSNTPGNNQNPGGPATTGDNGEVPNTEDDDDDTDGDANNQVFTAPIVALGNQGVLGTNTDNGGNQSSAIDSGDISDQEVKGTSDEKQDGTFSPLGFAWYWWLVALAAITGLWWLLAALRRRKDEE